MRLRSLHLILFLALSALVIAEMPARAPQDAGFSVKRTPKVGALTKYSLVIEYEVQGKKGSISGSVSEKVTNIDKDGNFSVEQAQLDASATYGDEKVDTPTRSAVDLTYKPNGLVTTIKGDAVDGDAYRMENLGVILDPGKKLNPGDEWTFDIKGDKTLGTVDAHADYTLVGPEKVGQLDTIKIKGTVKETSGDLPAMNEFTEWLSKDDGSLVQMDAKWTNAPFAGLSYPVTATIKMLRAGS